jgi:hypothetical protein
MNSPTRWILEAFYLNSRGLGSHRTPRLKGAARAAEMGPMQIEWREGWASRSAGTVQRSPADHAAHSEAGCFEKML